ncbi:hypothetical protein ACQKNB_23400, partial [Lysinibacillus xylanilyticus]|uniref:hypothetical protein n=1 Tax=Lysinibacillus xylanilyticus TaxID=582475 RepID=UPI003D0412E5
MMSQLPLTLMHHTRGLFLFQAPENPSNRNAPVYYIQLNIRIKNEMKLKKFHSQSINYVFHISILVKVLIVYNYTYWGNK